MQLPKVGGHSTVVFFTAVFVGLGGTELVVGGAGGGGGGGAGGPPAAAPIHTNQRQLHTIKVETRSYWQILHMHCNYLGKEGLL